MSSVYIQLIIDSIRGSSMNTLFIVNPAAGRGKCFRIWTRFEEVLQEKANFPYAVRLTRNKGDAKKFSATALQEGFERIISVGGDGTLNEIVNGVVTAKIILGILPFGTGNDLAHALNLSLDFSQLMKALVSPTIRNIDLVKINQDYFINASGIGIDGYVVKHIDSRPMIKKLGKIGYMLSAFQTLMQYHPVQLNVTIDGENRVLSNVWILAMANGPYFGGGMKICPDASLTDGLLDLCMVQNLTKLSFLKLFPLVYSGRHVQQHQYVTTLKAKKVTFDSPAHLVLQMDGEIKESTSVTVEVIPGAIQLIT